MQIIPELLNKFNGKSNQQIKAILDVYVLCVCITCKISSKMYMGTQNHKNSLSTPNE